MAKYSPAALQIVGLKLNVFAEAHTSLLFAKPGTDQIERGLTAAGGCDAGSSPAERAAGT